MVINKEIIINSTYPFLLKRPYLPPPSPTPHSPPPTVLLINNSYSWKGKLKHTDVDISAFLLTKCSLTKHIEYLLEALYRTSETSKLEIFTKKVNGL